MKTVARIASLLLALVMVFGLSVTAFAAETGTITVDNPIAGQTYTAYKIFDVTYDEAKSTYAYSIAGNSEWYDVVKDYTGITLTKAASENTYAVTKKDTFSAAAFANVLKAAVTGKTGGITLNVADGKATATGLDLGYYFVTSSTGALCNLTTTNPDATIHDKNDVPFDKVDDKASVEVGETVNYTITGKVPDTTGFTTYEYTIADTMSAGLTFQKNVAVTVDGVTLDAGKYVLNQTDNGFTLTIKVMGLQEKVGKEIKVTYTAVTNDKAVAVISKNSATLTYSNNPTDSSKTTTTPEDIETVYSAKLVIDKYETGKESTKLAGATFVLYKEVTAESATEATKMYYKWNDTEKKVEWVENQTEATKVTTNSSGAAVFNGLKDGTYKLVETAAPAGYNLLATEVEVVINGAKATEVDLSSLTATAKVENSTGTTIPETGGIGTTIFYVAGGLLVLGAVILLITKKRMSSAK